MAYAIALHTALSGQGGTAKKQEKHIIINDLPPDRQDDYFRASKEDKLLLAQKWGIIK
jgi:hypothetical protein